MPACINFDATFPSLPYDRFALRKSDVRLTPVIPDSSAMRSTSPTIFTLFRYTSPISETSSYCDDNKHYARCLLYLQVTCFESRPNTRLSRGFYNGIHNSNIDELPDIMEQQFPPCGLSVP